jgi:hypothetical protein
MWRLALLLIPAALFGGQPRYARLGEFEGKVEVQLQAADPWIPAQRNLTLPETAWMRTGAGSRLEIELDDGSAMRFGPDSLAEVSDYSRLSTGQRVTLLSLDRGIAYFTGQPEGKDALMLALPGAQVSLRRGARVRLEARDQWSQVAVIEGEVRFSSPSAEFDLYEGQTARVEPANTSRFFLYREVAEHELDRWSEQRDQALASPGSGRHVPAGYGAADLDRAGEWVDTEDLGTVWKPQVPEDWVPYRNGRWHWYDSLGYTWVSADAWGWLPYHYGRWTRRDSLGWVWAPFKSAIFKPGEVYWLRGATIAGWGPLAPGEEWTPAAPPRQFLNVNTTWATFQQDARVIDPAGFTSRPREPLGVAAFALALPSPALVAARLEAVRPTLRAGSTRVVPQLAGVTYQGGAEAAAADSGIPQPAPGQAPSGEPPVAVVTNPTSPEPPVVVITQPPPPPVEVIYPVPVYTGVIVVNPPENDDRDRRRRRRDDDQARPQPAPAQPQPPPIRRTEDARDRRVRTPSSPPPQPAPAPAPAPQPVRRTEDVRDRRERAPSPPPQPPQAAPAPAPAEVPRSTPEGRAGVERGPRNK